ncbi:MULTISPECIES: hypothetical protein [Kitasatospora]|uniref:Uncharacterized protein n=1 Tax=Kitasatospora setae (strain ATCC 33774 / DSM 43861 / JCM 3304 / KCC A-0304 / NBRC 14216 / KM-6054) TaxID=452652 RepID=E4NHK8_KITSK|nr:MULTISPECIES: hypothetical protein [Kitasatospora]BAJ30988.1 hypothetical protein KSE_52120 [Kitasatospora setae KM-6054]
MGTYTVTVAGTERYDGEKPYTYVIDYCCALDAVLHVLAHHRWENETADVIPVEVLLGEPSSNCGYVWNDLRGRQR